MQIVFLDFESFWSDTVTLKKLSPGEYLAHPEFELQSVSIRIDRNGEHGRTKCYFGETAIREALDAADIPGSLVIAHNMNGFDALILVWKLGYTPRLFGCTLSMARPVYGHLTGLGLGALVKFLGLGFKDDTVLHQTKGRHLRDFLPDELERMAKYNCDDTDQCADLFYHLKPFFNAREMLLIDMTARARAFPELELDQALLEETLIKERAGKRESLLDLADALGIERGITDDITFESIRRRLASAPQFVALLESLGVDAPYKPSPKNPENFIPALAKTDEGFIELLESEDELVAQAAAARLSIKSTLLETRIGKLLSARRTATALPIPLKYAGAKVTDRWSGEEYNSQNLPRIIKGVARNSDALRQSITAPDGHVIGVADQSAIELRVNHFLWQVPRTTTMYAANPTADLYRDFAGARWGIPPAEVSDHQRQMGKVSHLQLQFGSGWRTFQRTAKAQHKLVLEDGEAEALTYDWRRTYQEIPQGWETCQESLHYMAEGTERAIDPGGLCHTVKDGILLPTGHLIRYPRLRQALMRDPVTGKEKWEWIYGVGRFTRRIYGPKMTANIVQALARDTVSEDAVTFFLETDYRWKMMTHDELIYVWPKDYAQALLARLQATMRAPRKWWPQIVLWSAGGLGHRYSEAH